MAGHPIGHILGRPVSLLVLRRAVGVAVVCGLGAAGQPGCGEGSVRFGPDKESRQGGAAAEPGLEYEVDLAVLGGRRHRVVAITRGEDVRPRLPKVDHALRPQQPVFALLPVADRWTHVCWRSAQVVAAEGQGWWRLRTEEGRTFSRVPGAFVVPASAGPLRAGQVVRAHAGRSLPFGRVVAVRGDRVRVAVPWLGARRELQVHRWEVLAVDSGRWVGGPVVYRLSGVARLGSLVRSQRKHRWVLGAGNVVLRLPWTRVQPVTLTTHVPAGARVRVAWPVVLHPAQVVRALEGGLLYDVRGSEPGLGRRRVGFAELVPAPPRRRRSQHAPAGAARSVPPP